MLEQEEQTEEPAANKIPSNAIRLLGQDFHNVLLVLQIFANLYTVSCSTGIEILKHEHRIPLVLIVFHIPCIHT
jgi:hypothetical protein